MDGTQEDVAAAYFTIRNELTAYSEKLAEKPEFLVLNKRDALDDYEKTRKLTALKAVSGKTALAISGVTGEGVDALLRTLMEHVAASKGAKPQIEEDAPWLP